MKNIIRTAAAAVIGMALSSGASATLLYGTTGSGGTTSDLITIDITTGVTSVIGSIGLSINGLTWDGSTNTLYGSVRGDAGLVTIDTSTGAATGIGTGFGTPDPFACDDRNVLLAANSSGGLYGWADPCSDDLQGIDTTTGASTGLVGDADLSTFRHGMAFDSGDDLYLVNGDGNVYSISTATGGSTLLGSLAIDAAHHGDFNDDDGLYYGLDGTFGTSAGINVLDITGGAPSVSGSIALDRSDVFTLAFVDDVDVPEPATLALLGLGLVGGLGAAARRRS